MTVDENDGGMLEESLGGDIDKQPGSCFYGEHTVVIAYR